MQSNFRFYVVLFVGLCGFALIPLFLEFLFLANLPPLSIFAIRFFFTTVILVIGALIYFPSSKIFDKAFLKIFLLGLSIQTIGTYSYTVACQEIGVASASVISYCFYLWIFGYEIACQGRKLSLGVGLGIILLMMGTIGLLKFNPQALNLKGMMSLLIGTLSWASIIMVLEKNPLDYYLSTLYLIAGVTCGFIIIAIVKESPLLNIKLAINHIFFFIGFSLFSTLLPFLIKLYVLPFIGAYNLAIFSNIEQLLVLFVTGFLLQGSLLPIQILAGAMIVMGVFFAIYFDKTKRLDS